jgi:hypothetical protein
MPPTFHKSLISLIAALAILVVLPGIAAASQSKNYWLLSSTGQVFAYGKAKTHGSEAGKHYSGRITGLKGTPNGGGYWIVTTKKHYGFGDANRYKYRAGGLKKYTGKLRPKHLRGKIIGYTVATIPTKSTKSGGGTKTTTTGTTTTPKPPTVACTSTTIETSSLNGATATNQYSQTLTAGGISGGTWSWAVQSGSLPSGLTLSSSGVISGTPAASTAGTQSTFALIATNSQCLSSPATRSLTLAVGVPPMSITSQNLNSGEYGVTYSNQTLTATGGQLGDYQWTATGRPTGLSISTSGVISGTPQTTGNFNVQITVADSTGQTTAVSNYYTITVTFPPLQITTASLNSGQDTIAYTSQTLTATGGTAMEFPPNDRPSMYVWSATGLPTGMSLSTSGVLSGTPTESGTYDPQITVADAAGNVPSLTQTFTLDIALAPLTFTTTTLTAIQGQSYTGQVVAQGGQAPYTMYRLSGSLPSGMSFNNGTITVASSVPSGDYQFTIGISDSQSDPATGQETFNMWVAPSEASPDLSVTSTQALNTNWSGYIEQSSTAFTSASGTFTVPTIPATSGDFASVWLGFDGWNGSTTVLQAGITATTGSGGVRLYQAWWETAPNPPQNQFNVSPGDSLSVNIWQTGTSQWEVTLNDTSSGQGFAAQVSYSGPASTAEWIVEGESGDPALFYDGTVDFTNLAASQPGAGMLDIEMDGSFGTSTPSALSISGFSTTSG